MTKVNDQKDTNNNFTLYILAIVSSLLYAIGDVFLKFADLASLSTSFNLIQLKVPMGTIFFGLALILTGIVKLIVGKLMSTWNLGFTQTVFISLSILFTSIFGFTLFGEEIFLVKIFGLIILIIGTGVVIYGEELKNS